jgi:hypothetical protein
MHWRQGVMSTSEAMLNEKQSLILDLRAQIAAAKTEAEVLATRSRQRAADNLQRTTCSGQFATDNVQQPTTCSAHHARRCPPPDRITDHTQLARAGVPATCVRRAYRRVLGPVLL